MNWRGETSVTKTTSMYCLLIPYRGGSSQSFLSFQYFNMYCVHLATVQGEIEISDMKIVSSPWGVWHSTIHSPSVLMPDRNCLLSIGSIWRFSLFCCVGTFCVSPTSKCRCSRVCSWSWSYLTSHHLRRALSFPHCLTAPPPLPLSLSLLLCVYSSIYFSPPRVIGVWLHCS